MVGVNEASSLSTSWGTHSLRAEKEANSLLIFISGKTLFEQYFTEDMGASLSTLGVFLRYRFIFF